MSPTEAPLLSAPEKDVKASPTKSPRGSGHSPLVGTFAKRHIGPGTNEVAEMLKVIGVESLDKLIGETVPKPIRLNGMLDLPAPKEEDEALRALRDILSKNRIYRSFIGMGYSDCITPPVIQRNILENPGWYTAYTPYQAEIAQGRLEALLNFQTMIRDLTGMEIANASLLDEGTAAAEAVTMCHTLHGKGKTVFVSSGCHPQTIEIIRTRAEPLGIRTLVQEHHSFVPDEGTFALVLQYPATDGRIEDYVSQIEKAHAKGVMVIVAADLLSLTLLRPPGEFGADVVVGSSQRFGVPFGFGGPHAAFFATRDAFKRSMPGRLVGVSHDSQGRPALRLSLQTREQHIRREKATSNICTAQVLLAVMASMYAVYHGPEGLRNMARRIQGLARVLAGALKQAGLKVVHSDFFDTLRVELVGQRSEDVIQAGWARQVNLRMLDERSVGISLDETTTEEDVRLLVQLLSGKTPGELPALDLDNVPKAFRRESPFLTHPVFNTHHTETEMLRYIRRLESRDLSLTTSMIPLGSCTMKLNATSEMLPVTWPEVSRIHPFSPPEQREGYRSLFEQLERWLAEITGFHGVSLQPNAGSQGEYAGLLVIRRYHQSRGDEDRNVCLIPQSAHGTNPASAVMAGFRVVPVACREGEIDLDDLRAKAKLHSKELGAFMVTYPSTHGVFEDTIREVCEIVHAAGGQVYMDGANMNAQVGLCRPGDMGADVCHLNLHKTFCIPHGGGGPGVGPIGVAAHLAPFLPGHPVVDVGGERGIGAVSAAPWGSASILTISWMYIAMMGAAGLTEATKAAILNANYIVGKLESLYPVLFKGRMGRVAHECILDLRGFKARAGIEVEDVAKRLMDYGFHAPTISWPVAGTMMVEPTESESKEELDRFCDAMISIHKEIMDIEGGKMDRLDNPLKNAPHTARMVTADEWRHAYSREVAAFPASWTREHKFWPAVGRIDSVYGDRNLICSCPPVDEFGSEAR